MRAMEACLCQVNLDQLPKEYPDLDSSVHTNLVEVLSGRGFGRSVCHLWYDKETPKMVAYNGDIEKMKRKSPDKYVVA